MPIERPNQTPEELWRIYDATERRLTASVSERMLDLARLAPGMRVLDLATGRGEPAVRAAQRVAPNGTVFGVDMDEGVLRLARERATREGVSNLELRAANAATLDGLPRSHFDVTLSRWGLMYFDAPVAALAAARSAMRPGGTLVAALWAEPDRVPYVTLPRLVLARFAPVPAIDPEAPGPFRFADLGRITRDFRAAGFAVAHVEERVVDVMEATSAAELIAWCRAFGLDRLLAPLPDSVAQAWEAAMAEEAESRLASDVIRLGGVTRLVVAVA